MQDLEVLATSDRSPRVPGVVAPWPPDLSYFNGKYPLDYSLSTLGNQRSASGWRPTSPWTLPNSGGGRVRGYRIEGS